VLAGAFFVFVTDRGLMQIDTGLRLIQRIDAVVPPNLAWLGIGDGGSVLYAGNGSHVAQITASQSQCEWGYTSRRGLPCEACSPMQYVSAPGVCTPCQMAGLVCGPGFVLSGCNGTTDWTCVPCPDTPLLMSGPVRYLAGCSYVYTSPCPVGYYGTEDCVQCPAWASTSGQGASHFSDCACQHGGVMTVDGVCTVPAPIWNRLAPPPAWVLPYACSVGECLLTGCYLKNVAPRQCVSCLDQPGTIGLNGLWCSACTGFREPTPALDACICRAPARLGPDGACVCPAGAGVVAGRGCKICQAASFSAVSTVLLERWQDQSAECTQCPPGQTSGPGATACTACPSGWFREPGMATCSRCFFPGWYATDAGNGASCIQCLKSCGTGQRWTQCPVDPDLFVCTECTPELMPNEHWMAGLDNMNCKRECNDDYFRPNGGMACNQCSKNLKCPAGTLGKPCSTYADFACTIKCSNATMPVDNAEWSKNCEWNCKKGYVMRQKSVFTWTEFACEEQGSTPWLGWF